MIPLSVSEAIALVRKNLDELDPNGSAMYEPTEIGSADEYGDNRSLDEIISRNLPEAINSVQLDAPIQLLEGVEHTFSEGDVTLSDDGVLTITVGDDSKFLRLVAFQASGSPVVVTDVIPEASPEGRKQLNKFIRGRFDRPRLVLVQGRHTGPVLKYYTLDNPEEFEDARDAVARFSYAEEQFYPGGEAGYSVSRRLRQNVIDRLTAIVLETYSDRRAEYFNSKSNTFPTI